MTHDPGAVDTAVADGEVPKQMAGFLVGGVLKVIAAAIGPAVVQTVATTLAARAANDLYDGLRPKPAPPGTTVRPDVAQARKNLEDALAPLKQNKPMAADDAWKVADAIQAYVPKQPDYIAQAKETLKKLSPPNYLLAGQLEQTLKPAISKSPQAQSLLGAVGPEPTKPSAAQLFVLPEIKKLQFPETIKTTPWPQTTKFVWPEGFGKMPETPSSFVFPGQESK